MTSLSKLQSNNQKKQRRGRGVGSGRGRYSGRGLKGQNSRSGGRVRPGFEGGQNPLIKRLPKNRGFRSIHDKLIVVNTGDLDKKFKSNDKVNNVSLKKVGLVNDTAARVKVLANGELKKKLAVTAHSFSKSAAAQIKKAGGEIAIANGQSPDSAAKVRGKTTKAKKADPKKSAKVSK